MAKYIKAIDVWAYADAIMSGQIKLQVGQWIKLGNDNKRLSRFHHAGPMHITAFHFPQHVKGFMKYNENCKNNKKTA